MGRYRQMDAWECAAWQVSRRRGAQALMCLREGCVARGPRPQPHSLREAWVWGAGAPFGL